MYLMLHLLYHKCNPLIRIADGSILFKYLRLFKKKKLGFTPCKAEQPQRGMELQGKEAQKD